MLSVLLQATARMGEAVVMENCSMMSWIILPCPEMQAGLGVIHHCLLICSVLLTLSGSQFLLWKKTTPKQPELSQKCKFLPATFKAWVWGFADKRGKDRHVALTHSSEYFELTWKLPGDDCRIPQKISLLKSQLMFVQDKGEIRFDSLHYKSQKENLAIWVRGWLLCQVTYQYQTALSSTHLLTNT